ARSTGLAQMLSSHFGRIPLGLQSVHRDDFARVQSGFTVPPVRYQFPSSFRDAVIQAGDVRRQRRGIAFEPVMADEYRRLVAAVFQEAVALDGVVRNVTDGAFRPEERLAIGWGVAPPFDPDMPARVTVRVVEGLPVG